MRSEGGEQRLADRDVRSTELAGERWIQPDVDSVRGEGASGKHPAIFEVPTTGGNPESQFLAKIGQLTRGDRPDGYNVQRVQTRPEACGNTLVLVNRVSAMPPTA